MKLMFIRSIYLSGQQPNHPDWFPLDEPRLSSSPHRRRQDRALQGAPSRRHRPHTLHILGRRVFSMLSYASWQRTAPSVPR